ncbi:membrane protein insertase YidC [Chachezhania sediminis]|uniref:membrane protein insertase YidC n=1 Tax=Chachezhania sediminis TaxID=2599291 RepID=UPI00131AD445|nr:membrane protein insertase YidC [Chachezhania sediminis]
MDDQNKNLILATALSFAVILGWFLLFPPPEAPPEDPATAEQAAPQGSVPAAATTQSGVPAASTPGAAAAAPAPAEADAPRVPIETGRLKGSLSLVGGRIDELALKDYRETIQPDSPIVTLLKPTGTPNAYYALYGWAPGGGLDFDQVPGANTVWTLEQGETLTPDTPVTLAWDNGNGLTFRREISIDDNYMFTVAQSVENATDSPVTLQPYGIISRHGEPADLKNFFVLFEGAMIMKDGTLEEFKYKALRKLDNVPREGAPAEVTEAEKDGWIGFTDHYWMTMLIAPDGAPVTQVAKYFENRDVYETQARMETQTVAPGESATVTSRLFSGAKEWATIREYQKQGVVKFIDSIDWGWFFFLTKPIFWLLHEMHKIIGNMGWSIIGLTLILKAILFPLAFKSYVSMAKMKELQPEMEKLKEKAGDDRQKLQQGMMELYKTNKVNPAAGCLPILLQIPIFFSLYKVIFVTLELRQAPWFGPFQDLSMPDPTSIMNLFGLLPWAGPEPGTMLATVMIGILPLFLGVSMFLQQKLNPAPADPTQQMIFAWMPWVFMFMLGNFASGLVIYWITNNTITFTQQYIIMRSQGYTPDVFGNIKSGFKRTPKDKAANKSAEPKGKK